jgi:hypothetical protein
MLDDISVRRTHMTTGLRHFRFGALTATASMLAGISAAAAGICTLTNPLAFTTRPAITSNAPPPAADDVQSAWTAPIAEAMTVDVRAPVLASLPHRARVARAEALPAEALHEPTCTPEWHTMAQGPAGRHVTDICPGEALLPLSTEAPHTSRLIVLPTLRVLGAPLRGQTLDTDTQPRQDPRALADVDRALTERFEASAVHDFDRPLPDSATLIRDPAPLDWEPNTTAVTPPAGASRQCTAARQC